LIFLSNFIPQAKFYDLKPYVKIFPANSSNRFQWSILDGLKEIELQNLYIINSLPVGPWPGHYRKIYLSNKHSGFEMSRYTELATLNIPILKQLFRYFGAVSELRKNPDRDVLIYSTYLPYLMAATRKTLKKRTTLIVTDLPQYYDLEKVSGFRTILRKIVSKLSYHFIAQIDKFILLTEQMHDPLNVGDRPYIVMEGIAPPDGVNQSNNHSAVSEKKRNKEILFYSGSLSSTNGVRDLIDAFSQLKQEDIELWVCGSGEDEPYVKEAAVKDGRIRFFGFLSAEETISLQQQATILVNPRKGNDKYTEYSFPSKTMEYMLSGNPVVMYKLPGVPDEYDDHLFYASEDEPLTSSLVRIISSADEERAQIGRNAQEFIIREKNNKKQVSRILELMTLEER
jgi:glycosyltransferase involved in cell wall biosynthesis